MTENKLEEIIDLLAVYGGFNREYLRDKLLTFANDGRLETKNKIGQAAAMNSFDKLLGRNGELVEFRKKQVLAGAMYTIQKHYADKQNKMEAVAQLFGKKLNEPFMIESRVHKVNIKVRFTENGMEYFDDSCGRWYPTDAFMTEFLTGQATEIDE